MKIAIIGANETGSFIAAKLYAANFDVSLFKVHQENILQEIIEDSEFTLVNSTKPPLVIQMIEQFTANFDFIFLFSNPQFNIFALPIIKKNLKKNSVIISFQERLDDQLLRDEINSNFVITGVFHFQSLFKANHSVKLTTDLAQINDHAFDLAIDDTHDAEDYLEVKAILDYIGQTQLISANKNIRWTRALFLIAVDRLASALNCRYNDILHHPIALSTSIHLADEIMRTAKKQKIQLSTSYSLDFNAFIIDSDYKYDELVPMFKSTIQIHSISQSAFTYSTFIPTDLLDEVLAIAHAYDQPTPYLDLLSECLRYRHLSPFHENIQQFAPLVNGTAT